MLAEVLVYRLGYNPVPSSTINPQGIIGTIN
jgi:hypothetical protein